MGSAKEDFLCACVITSCVLSTNTFECKFLNSIRVLMMIFFCTLARGTCFDRDRGESVNPD